MQQNEFSMEQDDAGMVDDILKELSKDNNSQQNIQQPIQMMQQPMPQQLHTPQQIPQQGMMPMPEPIGQNIVHPDAAVLNQQFNTTPEVVTKQTNSNPWWKVVLNKIKKPVTLTVLIFLLFNPLTRKLLNNNIPALFGSTSHLHQNISIMLLSIIVGVSFTFLNKLL